MKLFYALVLFVACWPSQLKAEQACVVEYNSCTYSGSCQSDSYQGSKSTTVVGKECQVWSSDTPHESEDKEVGDHNHCRNPDDDPIGPWCYTSDPEQQWAYCFTKCLWLQECLNMPSGGQKCISVPTGAEKQACYGGNIKNYSGTKATTVNEILCQVWSSDTPHESEDKEVGDHNYCRNPDNDPNGAWCYTSDPELEWDYCFSNCKNRFD